MYVAKTKALDSFAVTAKLVCVFVFAYAKRWFSHDAAQLFINLEILHYLYSVGPEFGFDCTSSWSLLTSYFK